MSDFDEWFDMIQDVGERCGTSLGQQHRDLMEAAWQASRDSIEIKLPFLFPHYLQDVIDSIKAQGINAKPWSES